MQWSYKNLRGGVSVIGPEEAVRLTVCNAPNDRSCTIEVLDAQHDKLMQIVGTMLSYMPEDAQRAVVAQHGCYMQEK